jgi:hypothetical protein
LWPVLEHAPHRMFEWVHGNQSAVGGVVDSLVDTLRFLHGEGVFHFDAHYGNVITDGSLPLLTDFGLVTDVAFELSESERAFVDRHHHYDFGETIYSVGNALLGFLFRLPEEDQRALLDRLEGRGAIDRLVSNVESLTAEGSLGIAAELADVVVGYRPVILFMSTFFDAMRSSNRKNTFFDDALLARLLADAGVDVT